MAQNEACCTCATLLTDTKIPYDTTSEKPLVLDRRLDCCSRVICATCQHSNPRFESYCPFCQISTAAEGALPATGLRLPPSYTKTGNGEKSMDGVVREEAPPAYDSIPQDPNRPDRPSTSSSSNPTIEPPTNTAAPADTIHHLSPTDTLPLLSLKYTTPLSILRSHNSFPVSGTSDYLLPARKTLLIPSSHYTGPSLSIPPDPVEEERKMKLRRWMMSTKCAEYDVATLYLRGAEWDVQEAVERWRGDEKWERENPLKGKGKGSESRGNGWRSGGGSLMSQIR